MAIAAMEAAQNALKAIWNPPHGTIKCLVPKDKRYGRKTCVFEVLVFENERDYVNAQSEEDFKKALRAKFRSFEDAEMFSKMLLRGESNPYLAVIRD